MTGTPLDLTPFGPLLSALGLLYWLLAIALIAFALWYPNRWLFKLPLAALVLVIFAYPVVRHAQLQQVQSNESKARLDAAMALFAERCKTAGEKIKRTVENVDGVVWMKWREKITGADNFADQFRLNDPYGQDCGAEDCIKLLLRATRGLDIDSAKQTSFTQGFRFVESVDPADGQAYRYALRYARGGLDRQVLEREPVSTRKARYGILWNDISTRTDREHWIAGSSMKVIDLQTNEVFAERIGYMIDKGQGSQTGFRSPWLFAEYTACPAFERSEAGNPMKVSRSRNFVQKILKPTQGE
jgi:hypothetical protein